MKPGEEGKRISVLASAVLCRSRPVIQPRQRPRGLCQGWARTERCAFQKQAVFDQGLNENVPPSLAVWWRSPALRSPRGLLDGAEEHPCQSQQLSIASCNANGGQASLSAERYANVTVTLNICCCGSVNGCHKSVAISGVLSVCAA